MKAFFEAVDIIPVNRSDRSESLKALDIALEKLQEGKVFGIYPEGTRSRDGYLYRGKIGVAWLAHSDWRARGSGRSDWYRPSAEARLKHDLPAPLHDSCGQAALL